MTRQPQKRRLRLDLVSVVFISCLMPRAVTLVAQLGTTREPIGLSHLPATDVWHKTYWIRTDMRLSYSLRPSPAGDRPTEL